MLQTNQIDIFDPFKQTKKFNLFPLFGQKTFEYKNNLK